MQASINSNVQKEQLAQLLSVNTKTTTANVVLAVLLVYMLNNIVPQIMLYSWLLIVLMINLTRFLFGQYFDAHPVDSPYLINKRLNIFRMGLFVTASAWGASLFLVHGERHVEYQLFIAFLLAGLSAGSAVIYSIELLSALAFLAFSIVPMLIGFVFAREPIFTAMTIAGVIYVLFLYASIKSFNQYLIEGIILRLEAVKNAEEIKKLAFYDALTGLPNRRLLLERLERTFLLNWRTGKRSAILFIDLDHFKVLNDTLGHDKGDELLKQVAIRLTESLRESDTVSRFGGDEFVVMLENLDEDFQLALSEVKKIAELILANLNQPYRLVDVEYVNTPSIGIAFLGEHGRTQSDLLRYADIAMYHAKQSGRNAVSIYEPSMEKSIGLQYVVVD